MIDGWVHAVPTMQRGEVAKVTMQSEYAYGASGNNVIPPNSALTITIELFDWRRECMVYNVLGSGKYTILFQSHAVTCIQQPNVRDSQTTINVRRTLIG